MSHTETILVYQIQDVTSTQQCILLAYNLRLPICSMSLQTTFMASRIQIMCFVIPQQVRPFNNLFCFYHLIIIEICNFAVLFFRWNSIQYTNLDTWICRLHLYNL